MKLVGPTLELADYLAGLKFEDLPEYVIKRAQLSLLDFIGYTVYGCQEEPAKLVIQFVKMLKEKEISTVIGYGTKTSCIQAAFANSFISRISELDDTHRSSRSHPGDIIHPVALAVGEKLESNGRDLITSIVAGYEAAIRAADSVTPGLWRRGWSSTATACTFGGAVVAGKLLGLDAKKMAYALGLAGIQAAGTFAWETSPEARDVPNFYAAKAAYNGTLAALFSSKGFVAPLDIFENKKGFCKLYSDTQSLEKLTEGIGREFKIMEMSTKPYMGCRCLHGIIEATSNLVKEHSPLAGSVKKIVAHAHTKDLIDDLRPWLPRKEKRTRFSAQFNVALLIKNGEAALRKAFDKAYVNKNLADPEFRDLVSKIEVVADSSFKFPDNVHGGSVEVEMKNGTKYNNRVDHPKGDPENPLTERELINKFRYLTSNIYEETQVNAIIELCSELDRLSNIKKITELLVIQH